MSINKNAKSGFRVIFFRKSLLLFWGTIAMPAFKVSQLMHKTYRRYIANFYRHFAIFYIPISMFSVPANMTYLNTSRFQCTHLSQKHNLKSMRKTLNLPKNKLMMIKNWKTFHCLKILSANCVPKYSVLKTSC